MCRPVQCMECNKTTWAGCGAHVAQVKALVAPERWCTCREEASTAPATGSSSSLWGSIKKTLGG